MADMTDTTNATRMDDTFDETSALYDIGIVGGGPAGLSAAIWSARYGHSVVLIDSGEEEGQEVSDAFCALYHFSSFRIPTMALPLA